MWDAILNEKNNILATTVLSDAALFTVLISLHQQKASTVFKYT